VWVLQLSDLHFGQTNPTLNRVELLRSLVQAVRDEISRDAGPLVVTICGDIVDRGNEAYYDTAARGIEADLLEPLGSPDVVCCPGNHDVVTGEDGLFSAFNRFAFRITNKADISFTREASVANVILQGFEFVLVNSMYRGSHDRHHGEVNIDHLHEATRQTARAPRILLLHHSLIPNNRSDTSTLVNSYQVLQLAVARGVYAILHGHLHSQNVLTVGNSRTAVLGVGSLLYRPWPNYNNGFNLIKLNCAGLVEALSYRFIADLSYSGNVGTYQKTILPIL
jgi:3',5'-cyclic AMP phosphodiesterase CpdA